MGQRARSARPGRAQQGQSAPGSAQRGRTGDAGRTAAPAAGGQRRAPSSRAVRPGGALLRTRVPATTRASRAEHPQVGCSSPSTPGGRSGDKAGRGAGCAAHRGLGRVRGRPPSLLGLAGGCAAPAHRDADHRRQGGTKEATAAHGSSTACQAARPEAEGGGAVRGLRPGPGVGGGRRKEPRGAGRGSPGSWGRSGCRRRCTPRGSSPPRSPGRRPGWRRPSLKNRGETFRAGAAGLAGPHPCPAPEAPATPPSSHH